MVNILFVIIEPFAISYLLSLTSGNLSKSAFSKGVGHSERKFQTERGVAHQPLLVSDDCPFVLFRVYQNIASALFGFVTKHACDRQTDGRSERRTKLRLTRPC